DGDHDRKVWPRRSVEAAFRQALVIKRLRTGFRDVSPVPDGTFRRFVRLEFHRPSPAALVAAFTAARSQPIVGGPPQTGCCMAEVVSATVSPAGPPHFADGRHREGIATQTGSWRERLDAVVEMMREM